MRAQSLNAHIEDQENPRRPEVLSYVFFLGLIGATFLF